jgi:hypothetical protein
VSRSRDRFDDNDLDFTILFDLTDQGLEKIGVASLGIASKLLRPIATLHAGRWWQPPHLLRPRQAPWGLGNPDRNRPSSPPSTAANVSGEHRYLGDVLRSGGFDWPQPPNSVPRKWRDHYKNAQYVPGVTLPSTPPW